MGCNASVDAASANSAQLTTGVKYQTGASAAVPQIPNAFDTPTAAFAASRGPASTCGDDVNPELPGQPTEESVPRHEGPYLSTAALHASAARLERVCPPIVQSSTYRVRKWLQEIPVAPPPPTGCGSDEIVPPTPWPSCGSSSLKYAAVESPRYPSVVGEEVTSESGSHIAAAAAAAAANHHHHQLVTTNVSPTIPLLTDTALRAHSQRMTFLLADDEVGSIY
mmetsp:Transcript_3947/g.12517  ORF Transcript_3947/g.12517 Transcript_3947/m.12517 type:complete len:223 (-) Transcript_3947:612-1280(-)|eukprot:CAMPEP_0174841726 /NCGR_PEP_ID=MMETSP1114-20130205/9496_1 /TAXON_ID=312471 /ORGANISM="Neobodo designis, Strain CCAP 1951/1" /LENGTH=222 /DNA_ID=CAMNT_0016075919 /DNA_START=136 /DNA_END=804 /DNA_ORIENTATION=+